MDLPVPGNGEVEFPFDLRPSRFDYSEIFGGFRAVDFAVSYEDLLRQSSDGYDSSDEAWSPSPSELLSDESDLLACSEGHQSLFSSDKFFTLADINLRTKPSQLPPPSRPLSAFGIKSDQSDRPNSSSKGSAGYAFERISGETSPPSFGEEVDTSSPTAALKDAIARAQAKCQRAKESMEKKKQGLQSCKGHSDNISTEDVTNGMFDETPEGEEKEEERGALERNMKENQLKESIWLDKIDKKSKQGNENNIDDIVMDLEQVQNKRDQDLACKREDEDKEMQDMFKWDQTYKHFTVKNEKPEEQNVNHEKGESKEGESEVRITKIPKQVQEEERFSLASESGSENISEDSDELEEIEGMIVDGCKLEELDENASYNEQITIDCESGEALDRACVSNDETVHVPLMHEKKPRFYVTMFRSLTKRKSPYKYKQLADDVALVAVDHGGGEPKLSRTRSWPPPSAKKKVMSTTSELHNFPAKSQAKQVRKVSKILPIFSVFDGRKKKKATARPEFSRYLEYVREGGFEGVLDMGTTMTASATNSHV
nr:auxilin-like protein 1 [Ipomoea batatas]